MKLVFHGNSSGNLAVKGKPRTPGRAALIVLKETFAKTVEVLNVQVDAKCAPELSQRIRQINLNAATVCVVAHPAISGELKPFVRKYCPQIHISAIPGNIGIVAQISDVNPGPRH